MSLTKGRIQSVSAFIGAGCLLVVSQSVLGNTGQPSQSNVANLTAEARDLATRYLAVHSVKCDQYWVVKWGAQSPPVLLVDPKVTLMTAAVSPADRLNGTQWSGRFDIESDSARICVQLGRNSSCERWLDWKDTRRGPNDPVHAGDGTPRFYLVKKASQWLMSPYPIGVGYTPGQDSRELLEPVSVSCGDGPSAPAASLDDVLDRVPTDMPLTMAIDSGAIDRATRLLATQLTRVDLVRAFHTAAFRGRVDMLPQILAKGVPIDSADFDGTALFKAQLGSMNNGTAALEWLLKHGASVNTRDGAGETVLMHAAFDGDLSAVKLLLANGADVNVRSKHGDSALSIARGNKHAAVAAALEAAGAK